MPKFSQISLFVMSALFILSIYPTQATENNMITNQKKQENNNRQGKLSEFEQKIAARMVLDIRYFCDDETEQVTAKNCRKAVTELPKKLSQMITDSNIGGIVLFAENVIETKQVVKLTHEIQTAALKSAQAKPIIIAIDQEGGRVARFAKMTGFAGNMAIGATYEKSAVRFSTQVNSILGKELNALGINNNYAPVVDVNTNANNPVINTRSYGESAEKVAKLGVAAVDALQAQGVMATLKHFPGHGDTHVDSHIGLPKVDHDLVTIENVDLAPFTLAITKTAPAMIMTAHIQYPVLDSSTFTAQSGEKLIRPATMSKKILTELLRDKMNFDGIIATDALDMAGISHYFTEVEAVVETFIAGADLAVMPFKIRKPSDITAFNVFIKAVAQELDARIKQTSTYLTTTNLMGYSLAEFEHSLERLSRYKQRYIQLPNISLPEQIKYAEALVAKDEHLAVEQELANAAVTVLQGDIAKLLKSISGDAVLPKVHLLVANEQEYLALSHSVNYAFKQGSSKLKTPLVSYSIADNRFNILANEALIKAADLVIATIDVKTASLVDIGGMDDLASVTTRVYGSEEVKQHKYSYGQLLQASLTSANKQKKASLLIAKGSPYQLADYTDLAEVILLNFDDRIYNQNSDNLSGIQANESQFISPGFNAAMSVVFSNGLIQGRLPVSLKLK